MANNFGRVNVSITASTGGLAAGLASAGKQLSGFRHTAAGGAGTLVTFNHVTESSGGAIRAMASSVESLLAPLSFLGRVARSTFGQLTLFSAARSAVNTIFGMASAASEGVDQLSKFSRRLGTTYGELAGLKLAGDLAGVGIESIATAMTKADVAFVKAQNGSKAANAAFATLGLTTEQLAGMGSAERFEAIASAIAALPTEAERSAAAIALFGRAGAQLLPLFEGGAQGIRQARQEAERFGLTLTNAQGQNVEEMNDSFTRVYAAIQGIVQQVTAYLAPAITGIAKQFTDFVGSVGGANIGQAIGEALLQGAEYLAQVGDYLIANFGPTLARLFEYLSQVGGQWDSTYSTGLRVAKAHEGVILTLKFVGITILGFISDVVSMLLNAVASAARLVPGFSSTADSLQQTGDYFEQKADGFLVSAEQTLAAAGTSFSDSFYGTASQTGAAIAFSATGPLRRFVQQARQEAQAAAAAVDQPSKPSAPKSVAAVVRISSEDLKAIVAGSSEAESFRNSLRRGADPRLDTKEEQKRTADATERTADATEDIARNSGIGVALIA